MQKFLKSCQWLLFDPSIQRWAIEARLIRGFTFLWLFVGLVVLCSASFATGLNELGDGLYYFKQQLIWVAVGLVLLRFVVQFPLRNMFKVGTIGLFFIFGLLIITLIFGTTTNGATRWLPGPIRVQPSELIKPFLMLQAAQLFGQWHRHSWKKRRTWLMVFAAILLVILLQPSLSMTMFFVITLLLMALAAGLPWVQILSGVTAGAIAAVVSVSIRSYQLKRIISFLDPWADSKGDGYQLTQSLMTIGSGEIWGTGFGLSQQKTFLPEQYNDFIFSVFAEEFGLAGCLILVLFLLFFLTLGLSVARKCKDPVVRSVAIGSTVILVGQAFFNIGVASGVLPTTGLTFPFFSYGGSSMLSSLAVGGLLIRAALEMNSAEVISIGIPGRKSPITPQDGRSQRLARLSQRKSSIR